MEHFAFSNFPEITVGIFRNLPAQNLPEFRNSGSPVLTLTPWQCVQWKAGKIRGKGFWQGKKWNLFRIWHQLPFGFWRPTTSALAWRPSSDKIASDMVGTREIADARRVSSSKSIKIWVFMLWQFASKWHFNRPAASSPRERDLRLKLGPATTLGWTDLFCEQQ